MVTIQSPDLPETLATACNPGMCLLELPVILAVLSCARKSVIGLCGRAKYGILNEKSAACRGKTEEKRFGYVTLKNKNVVDNLK